MPSPNQYLLGGSDPSPILAPATPSQATPWYLDPQQRGAVTSVLSALAAPLTDAYQHASNLAQGRGDYGMELASGLLAAAGMAAPPAARGAATAAEELAPAVEQAVARGIKAYHASPYDFERFDPSKIGTGQGAQSYGHGMYVAESPAVSGRGGSYDREFTAKNLRQSDTTPQQEYILRALGEGKSDMQILTGMARDGIATDFDQASNVLNSIKSNKSHIYEVNINSDPEHFLDWDKPLSQQSDKVKSAFNQMYAGQVNTRDLGTNPHLYGGTALTDVMLGNASIGAFPKTMVPAVVKDPASYLPLSGKATYEMMARDVAKAEQAINPNFDVRSPQQASQYLRDAGIPGIKYLDQGSRASGEGTHNYVVFDPATIDIIRKYGIAALMGGGAAAAGAGMTPQPAQAGHSNVADTIRALQPK